MRTHTGSRRRDAPPGTLARTAAALLLLLAAGAARAVAVPGPLVDTAWLARHLDEVLVMDVRGDPRTYAIPPRWQRDPRSGRRFLVQLGGHIPGAVLVEYKRVRAERVIDGRRVQKMLPPRAAFEKLMRGAGLDPGEAVVIVTEGYGPGDMTIATRVYWQLKYYGHDNVAILDGGLLQWLLEGRPVETARPKVQTGRWKAGAGRRELLATSEDVAQAMKAGDVQLVDNRALAQYFGLGKPPYVYAHGHIPGAKAFPNELFVSGEQGGARFLPPERLRALARRLGIDPERPTITYCNSGHLASGGWFVLHELLGNRKARLYDGSMHEWTLEGRPVATVEDGR